MSQEIIISVLSRLPIDLAAEMRDWQEFVEGEGSSVDLRDKTTGESVSIRYNEEWDEEHLSIKSTAPGALFDRVVGRVVRALAMQVGVLKVRKYPYDAERLFTPIFKKN